MTSMSPNGEASPETLRSRPYDWRELAGLVLTTAIVLETGKGQFDLAIALGVWLILLTFMVNMALTWIQQRGARS